MNEELYKKYVDLIFRYLMSLCHDVDLAEELTQETFFRAIQSSFKVQENCKVSSWLCQIAKHVWYQELEKRKKHSFHPLDESIVSEKEIGEIFKKSENWARVTFYRAKQKLISSGRKENQDEV